MPKHQAIVERAKTIAPDAVAAVRITLLRRIVESELGTAASAEGQVRAGLGTMSPLGPSDLALELALCAFGIDLGHGVSLGWFRLGLLDPALADLERLGRVDANDAVEAEAAALADVLANDTMILEAGATDRRYRLLIALDRLRPGSTAALVFDPGDLLGASLRTVAASDEELARAIGRVLPLAAKATSVVPDRRQRASIATMLVGGESEPVPRDAVTRVIQQLLTAQLEPRGAGFVTVRPSNQRIGRAFIWLVPSSLPDLAPDVLGDLGVRLGTSGKRDNQARDTAMAGTCAALLGEMDGDRAVASLAMMLARVRNKPVRKQAEKALAAAAERAAIGVDKLVERSLPSFGLDEAGRRLFTYDTWTAEIQVEADGRVRVSWAEEGADPADVPSRSLRERAPQDVAHVTEVAEDISATLADERRRVEQQLAEGSTWSMADWRRRFLEHPLGRVHGRRLIWRFTTSMGSTEASAIGRRARRERRDDAPRPVGRCHRAAVAPGRGLHGLGRSLARRHRPAPDRAAVQAGVP